METHVLYLYRSFQTNLHFEDALIKMVDHPLIAIVQNRLIHSTREQHIKKYNLLPYEINQSNYDYVLLHSDSLDLHVLDITLDYDIDINLKTELLSAVKERDIKIAINILKDIREETDIQSVSFIYKGRQMRVSKFGVIEIDSNYDELQELAIYSPVGILTGVAKHSGGRYH
ncbi:hypothetical protein [Fictibacillus barbaricus]|uniref:Uncharacterized protein n=1 Tax=Fictibacillus barbaricus TaxID=182136 RepID=A0ABS2ZKL9_9BACL|nr:hypothetical protein [Fictibacillus barbaricus]MBN3547986.1 hypothetical protein [Fictibacillus barbaricus]GGB53096.1 hypothetical protein GCM10007199_18710 [Fictibacillus barbaricus]